MDIELIGPLSGKIVRIPDANRAPMPLLGPSAVVLNGEPSARFGDIDPSCGYPDVRSFRRKFGLLIPATNTSVEHALWSIVFRNQGAHGLTGVGLHTSNVPTPNPRFGNEAELLEYRSQFLAGLKTAVEGALLAQPQYLIMGMSLEHIITGIGPIRAPMAELERHSGLSCATWHDAAPAALKKFNAKRIGLLTPFETKGNQSAARMFEDLGFTVVATVGFSCAHAAHIAHIPDWAKKKPSSNCSPPQTTNSMRSSSAAQT